MSGLIEWILFLLLSTVAVVTAAGMLITMSMYRAGLALMASFVALAGLFVLLDADLLAVIQIMMNVGGMLVMVLFMVMLMIDPGGEMMWDMKRKMRLPGPGAFSMAMPRRAPRAEPAAPVEPPAAPPATSYTCPMHPEVRQAGPGECPICGMDLVLAGAHPPDGTPPQPAATRYTCPMHPEVRQDRPGECPICGMDLVPAGDHGSQPGSELTTGALPYTCPMHPEVRQDGPGECPICGMDLVPTPAPVPALEPSQAHFGRAAAGAGRTAMDGHTAMGRTGSEMSPRAQYEMMVGMAMSTAQLPWALVVGAVSAFLLILLVSGTPWPVAGIAPTQDATPMVGALLLERYMMAFEGAAVLILAGIVGAVIFAKREAPPMVAQVIAGTAPPATSYTCPMHPEVRQAGPGECPICGMDLVPAGAHPPDGTPPQPAATRYTCPMHPEVRQARPGECPICGMDLVPAGDHAADPPPLPSPTETDGRGVYSCPMHPEVRQPTPGECPICGMDLVPERVPPLTQPAGETVSSRHHQEVIMDTDEQQAEGTVYTCPMHPEVRENQPGRCPKCGMHLVPAQDEPSSSGTGGQTHGGHQ